jgi:hypothetical protein
MTTRIQPLLFLLLAACGGDSEDKQGLVQGLQLSPAQATGADPLTCSWTGLENASTASIRWRVNGATVPDETEAILEPEWTSKGDTVSCWVTPEWAGASAEQSNVVNIRNAPPTIVSAKMVPEIPTEQDLLKVEATAEDLDRADANKLYMHYKWLVNGEEVAYDEHVLGPSWWVEGNNITVYVSVGDGTDRSPAQLLGPVTIANSLPGPPVVEIIQNGDGSLTCDLLEPAEELDEADVLTYETIWREFGNTIQDGGASLDAQWVRPGAEYSCEMWASDEEGPGESHQAHFLVDGDVIRYQWSFNDAGARAGTDVMPLNDVDGDGLVDLLVSTPGVTGQKVEMGGVAIVGSASLGTNPNLGASSVVAKIWGNQPQTFLGQGIGTTPDFDGDGFDEVLLSSPSYTVFSEDVGLAVAVGSTHFLSQATVHFNAEGQNEAGIGIVRGSFSGEGYGQSVFGMDLNQDGLGDMFVGVHTETTSSPGFARVYSGEHLASGGPLYMEHTIASIQGIPGSFAKSIVGIPDSSGDGLQEILFSAPTLNNGNGGVLVLQSSDIAVFSGMENIEETLANDLSIRVEGEDAEAFGSAIAGGDWNGSGAVLVGASSASGGSGAAYLFVPSTGSGLTDAVVLTGDAGSGLGSAVAFVGDTDGDGQNEIAVGAPNSSDSFDGAGAVILFALADLTPGVTYGVDQALRVIQGEDANQNNGQSILGPGDLNGDGQDDLVMGATGLSAPNGWNEGGLFIWLRP